MNILLDSVFFPGICRGSPFPGARPGKTQTFSRGLRPGPHTTAIFLSWSSTIISKFDTLYCTLCQFSTHCKCFSFWRSDYANYLSDSFQMRLSEFWNYVPEKMPAIFVDVVEPNLINNDLNTIKIFSGASPPNPQIFLPGARPSRPGAPEKKRY